MAKNVKITDVDKGYSKLVSELHGIASITLGVQGDDADEVHPNAAPKTIGEIAAIHELGLGVPERSWLRSWMDANAARMQNEMAAAFSRVAAGGSRKKEMEAVGYGWTKELRMNIRSGKIRPALSPVTIARKGHSIPLLEGGWLMNSITFKLFLPQIKSIKDAAVREIFRGRK